MDYKQIIDILLTGLTRLVISVFVLVVSFKLINLLARKIDKRLAKKRVDLTISRVISSSFKLLFKLIIIIIMIGYLGVEVAGLSALIASLGVGISLAVQGTLSNFAGGALIIIMRPFKIGDYITTKNESGTVEYIHLFYTTLVTPDNKVVLVPNGLLANDVIVNYSEKPIRRCDFIMRISYRENLKLVKQVLYDACKSDDMVLKEFEPFVKIGNLGESAIDFYVRVWVKTENYWPTYYALLDKLKGVLTENGLETPYNQVDIHVFNKTQL